METLAGIENAPSITKIVFENCKINDYSAMKEIDKLQNLYVLNSNNTEINKLFTDIKETDYSNLTTLGIIGDDTIIEKEQKESSALSSSKSEVTDISILNELTDTTKKTIKKLFLNNNNISDISAISEFSNVTLIRLDRNNLTNLNGLEKMQSLKYLFAAYNNFGVNEVYNIELENYGKNETTDALTSLKGTTNITSVDLRGNSNLKWISYIKNNSKISYLDLTDCKSLVGNSLVEIKTIIIAAGNNAIIPAEYSLLLLDENLEKLDLSGQKITKDNFLTLSGYSKIKYLNLKNLTLTDINGNRISSEELNVAINDVLKTLPNITNLSVQATSSSYGISDMDNLEFVKSCKNLKELDIRGTKITTGTENGLELLNENSTALGTLRIDNEAIDLSLIQPTISRLNTSYSGFLVSSAGLCCEKASLYKQLENCTEITKLNVYDFNCPNYNLDSLDLSKCTKLENVYLRYFNGTMDNSVIIFPISLKSINWENIKGYFKLTSKNNSINLDSFTLQLGNTTQTNFNNIIENFVNVSTSISDFYIREAKNFNDLSVIENCLNLTIEKLRIGYNNVDSTRFNITNLDDFQNVKGVKSIEINKTNIKDISALSNYSELNSIYIYDSKIENLSGLENSTNLVSLTVKKNNLTNVIGIENLRNLTSLNLEENCLYDTISIKNADGTINTYNNLSLIAELHPSNGGSLKNVYLNGNSGITDFSILSKLSWEGKSGF